MNANDVGAKLSELLLIEIRRLQVVMVIYWGVFLPMVIYMMTKAWLEAVLPVTAIVFITN